MDGDRSVLAGLGIVLAEESYFVVVAEGIVCEVDWSGWGPVSDLMGFVALDLLADTAVVEDEHEAAVVAAAQVTSDQRLRRMERLVGGVVADNREKKAVVDILVLGTC